MMNSSLISAIVPVYNGEQTIARTIKSVLAQSFSNWELIIVDDGSTDTTASVLSSFDDPRIHTMSQVNKGLSGARNVAIREAQGRYLAFLDADDEWYPDFLATTLAAMEANDDDRVVGVYTSHTYIDERDQVLPQGGNSVVPADDLPDRLIEDNFFPPCVVLVRADIVRDLGMFDENLPGFGTEDKDLWFRITRKHTLLGIPKPLARYRVSPSSVSTNATAMDTNRMAVVAKHFGPDEGDPGGWPRDKCRSFGRAYLGSAVAYLAEHRDARGWSLADRAVFILPELLERLDTYFDLVCATQPRGYRGTAQFLDLGSRSAVVLAWLDRLYQQPGNLRLPRQSKAKATAMIALSMLSETKGDWLGGRAYHWRAIQLDPRLLGDSSSLRRTIKFAAGEKVSSRAKELLRWAGTTPVPR